VRVSVKLDFGEVTLEGDSASEILEVLDDVSPEFVERVSGLVSSKLTPSTQTKLKGVMEFTTDGPVIAYSGKLTHYEAIALVLYSSKERIATATLVDRLLKSSGIRSMVPARLNEMTKRGLVFKPDSSRPEYRLTTQGERWIEKEVVPKLKESYQS
jgi:hypothetical protein